MRPKKDEGNRPDVGASFTGRASRDSTISQAPSQLWAHCLERWVCSVNIERMRAQLTTATEQPERAMLWRLLREQEDTLQRLVDQDMHE